MTVVGEVWTAALALVEGRNISGQLGMNLSRVTAGISSMEAPIKRIFKTRTSTSMTVVGEVWTAALALVDGRNISGQLGMNLSRGHLLTSLFL